MNLKGVIEKIVIAFVCVAFAIYIGVWITVSMAVYDECIDHGFSEMYCIRSAVR